MTAFVMMSLNGHLAQLGERFLHTEEVTGSIPVVSTIRRHSSIGRAIDL
jgi:hypothetical protein